MDIGFPDVFGVAENQKGVRYLKNVYTGEIIAKVCTRCNEWHFINQFNKAGKGFGGVHSYCRDCHSERGKEYRFDIKSDRELNEQVAREVYQMMKKDAYRTARSLRNW